MPPPWRVQEVGRLAPPHVTIAVIEGAAHAMNFSHPGELAHVIGCLARRPRDHGRPG